MDKTGYFCVEVINSKRQLRGKLCHVVQFAANVNLNLSLIPLNPLIAPCSDLFSWCPMKRLAGTRTRVKPIVTPSPDRRKYPYTGGEFLW